MNIFTDKRAAGNQEQSGENLDNRQGTSVDRVEGSTGGVIDKHTIVHGDVATDGVIEVYGYLEGSVSAKGLVIQPDGKVLGDIQVEHAVVLGVLQGKMKVADLLDIGSSGSVNGEVVYRQIKMAQGAELSAQLKNIPPTLAGDLKMDVKKGTSVVITTRDINAIDPDDDKKDLIFNITDEKGGFISLASMPEKKTHRFSQLDIEKGTVLFQHDGESKRASFKVQIKDGSGALSGGPETVQVSVS